MHKRRQRAVWLLPLFALLIIPTAPALADRSTTLNLYLKGSRSWFDNDRLDGTPLEGFELEDASGGGAGFGYSIDDRWALEGVLDYYSADASTFDEFGFKISEDVEIYNYHFDLFYHFLGRFCGNYCWQPYVAFGAGEIRIEQDNDYGFSEYWYDRQTMVNLGLGVKYQLGPRWQVRADGRAYQGVENGGLDGMLAVTIGYQWSEYTVVVRDTDGDGFLDGDDECPQTPPGVDVDNTGCPIDSDRDGVPDYLDQCPGTPQGTAVDENGCPR